MAGLRAFLNATTEGARVRAAQRLEIVALAQVYSQGDTAQPCGGLEGEALEFVLNECSEYERYYGSATPMLSPADQRKGKTRLFHEAKRLLQALRASAQD